MQQLHHPRVGRLDKVANLFCRRTQVTSSALRGSFQSIFDRAGVMFSKHRKQDGCLQQVLSLLRRTLGSQL